MLYVYVLCFFDRPLRGVGASSYELEMREQEIIENLERQERERTQPAHRKPNSEYSADNLRTWKSMDYLKKYPRDPDLDTDEKHEIDLDDSQSGPNMYGLRGAKSCVDLDVHKQRMKEWEEKQEVLRKVKRVDSVGWGARDGITFKTRQIV